MKTTSKPMTDLEECKYKLVQLLREYNCTLTDPDEGSWVLLVDNDTGETINALK